MALDAVRIYSQCLVLQPQKECLKNFACQKTRKISNILCELVGVR